MEEIPTIEIDGELYQTGTLKQRILGLVEDVPAWNFKYIRTILPQPHEKAIYRAIKELVDDGAVRQIGQSGRNKIYSTKGLSKLPAIKSQQGEWLDLCDLFPFISSQYTDGHWNKLQEINELFLSLGQLFLVAELDDKELVHQYKELTMKFYKYKQSLTEMTAIVDVILAHPTMSGEPKLFKKIFNGNAPDQTTKNQFKLWLSQYLKDKKANEAANKPPTSNDKPSSGDNVR